MNEANKKDTVIGGIARTIFGILLSCAITTVVYIACLPLYFWAPVIAFIALGFSLFFTIRVPENTAKTEKSKTAIGVWIVLAIILVPLLIVLIPALIEFLRYR